MNQKEIKQNKGKCTIKRYVTCTQCGFDIRVPRQQNPLTSIITPFIVWEWADYINCPNCWKRVRIDNTGFKKPTGKNGVLYAIDIGLESTLQHLLIKEVWMSKNNIKEKHNRTYERTGNYVGIKQDRTIFTKLLFLEHNNDRWHDTCYVTTEITNDGKVTTWIE